MSTASASSGVRGGDRFFGGRLALAARDIKLAHSVFALPFAILGACLVSPAFRADGPRGADAWRDFGGQLTLVIVCMVSARTWAMLINRIADRRFDAANPRTAGRAVASGELRVRDAAAMAMGAGLGFLGACGLFWVVFDNPWPTWLSLPTLGWIAFYSFTKRFTWASHVFLGSALAASPIAAGIGVDPGEVLGNASLWWLAGMVLCWVGGFDVLYALQDEGYDRGAGLQSIPSRWGGARARWISRGLHVAAWGSLVLVWREDARLGVVFVAAVIGAGGLLVWEHVHLARRGIAGLPLSFGVINGLVALGVGAAGALDLAG